MLGLTVANVVGVPLTTLLSHTLGWEASFFLVAGTALIGACGCYLCVPHSPIHSGSRYGELSVLGRLQVWLTIAVVAIGFGGLFALYTYITPTLTQVTRLPFTALPFYFSLLGIGMTVGSLAGGWLADKSTVGTIFAALGWNAVVLPLFALTSHHPLAAALNLFAMGAGIAVVPAVQTRLMDVAGDAQTIAAALLHAAFNVANALGAWAGGFAIEAGLRMEETGLVGIFFGLAGAATLLASIYIGRSPHAVTPVPSKSPSC